ncbi:hypothetical protein D3C81_2327280 [compost metagenome]
MMQLMAIHWATDRYSWRNSRPDMAAMAGSTLIRVPKVRAGIRVRAIISRV